MLRFGRTYIEYEGHLGQTVGLVLVLVLVVLWGAVFVPSILRARSETSPITSVTSFRRGMHALSKPAASGRGGRWVVMPETPLSEEEGRQALQKRRLRIFVFLLGTAAITFVIGLFPAARDVLKLHIAVDLTLGAYVGMLIWLKQQSIPQRQTSQHRAKTQSPEPEYLRAEHF